MKSLELVFPEELLTSFEESEIRDIAQEALLVRLYDLGQIGSGRAAQLLGVSRRDFLTDVLGRYGVSWFDDNIDPLAEAAHG